MILDVAAPSVIDGISSNGLIIIIGIIVLLIIIGVIIFLGIKKNKKKQ